MSVILQAPPTSVGTGDVTEAELAAAIDTHEAAANPHPVYLTAAEGDAAYDAIGAASSAGSAAAAALAVHEADTTGIHGIANTNALVLTSDVRLSDARAPLAHDASLVTSGIFDDARIPSGVARDAEVTSAIAAEATARDLAIATAVAAIVNGAPGALDTLAELSAAFGDDANFVTTVTNALALKVPTSRTVNGHALSADVTVTASDIGLGNVSNTSDANKPVSTATQTALNLKANLASPTFTGTVTIPTGASITAPTGLVKGDVGLGNVTNTSDANKPVSTAQQTALDLKANLASPTFTGQVTIGTTTDVFNQSLNIAGSVAASSAPFGGLLFIGTEYNGIPCLDLRRVNGTSIASNTPIQSGDGLAGWHVGGSDGTAGTLRDVSRIYCYASETWVAGSHYGTEWRFYTHPNNTAQVSGGELAMTIGQNKSVTIVGTLAAGTGATFNGSAAVGVTMQRDKAAALASGDVVATLTFAGSNDALSTLKTGGAVRVLADAVWDGTHWPGRIEFLTAPNTTSGAAAVRGGWSAAGTFYVGTTLAAANASINAAGAFGFNGQAVGVASGWGTPSAGTDRTALTTGDSAAVVLNTLATLITDLLARGVITS